MLRPLNVTTLEEILGAKDITLDFTLPISSNETIGIQSDGQLNLFNSIEGLGRIQNYDFVDEGYFTANLDGYRRTVFEDGSYYIGWFKNNKREGEGKYVDKSGFTQEGQWANDQFLNATTSLVDRIEEAFI